MLFKKSIRDTVIPSPPSPHSLWSITLTAMRFYLPSLNRREQVLVKSLNKRQDRQHFCGYLSHAYKLQSHYCLNRFSSSTLPLFFLFHLPTIYYSHIPLINSQHFTFKLLNLVPQFCCLFKLKIFCCLFHLFFQSLNYFFNVIF